MYFRHLRGIPLLFCALLAAPILAVHSARSLAATFTVISGASDTHDANLNDGTCSDAAGVCSLRAAIEQANKLGGSNTVNVPAGTYLLNAAFGPLNTSLQNMTLAIVGTGVPGSVIVDGQNATTVFRFGGNGSQISVDNLVIQNGRFQIANPGGFGACIGAGINVISSVTMSLVNSIVRNNTVIDGSGGGICINFGTFTIDRSSIRDNTSTYGGAGIRITSGSPPGTLIITNSTISGNVSTGSAPDMNGSQGAGIISQANVDIRNSTLSGNIATGSGGAILAVNDAVTTLRNVTITNNGGTNGQINVSSDTASVTFESTIVANPQGDGGINCLKSSLAVFTSTGHNLDSGNTCKLIAATDLTNVNPALGPLQDNGGPTATHALLAGSLAIDRGSNSLNAAFDQRGTGFARVSGAAADIGAFEFQGQGGAPTLDIDASNATTRYDALTDGVLVLRYLFGLTGTTLTKSAIGETATRKDPAALKAYLDGIRNALDVDGNGTSDAATDGLIVLRYLFGLRGGSLISGAIGLNATRDTATAVESHINLLMP